METRRLVTALLAAMAVFYLWVFLSPKLFPDLYPPATTRPAGERTSPGPMTGDTSTRPATTRSDTTVPGVSTTSATRPAGRGRPATATAIASTGKLIVEPGTDETPVVLGDASDGSAWPIAVKIMPLGATIERVSVRGHYETVKKKVPYTVVEPIPLPDRLDESRLLFRVLLDSPYDIPLGSGGNSTQSTVSPELRDVFTRHNVPLSDEATILHATQGSQWLISDEERWYTLNREKNTLAAYKTTLAHSLATQKIQIRCDNLKEDVRLSDVVWTKEQVTDERVELSATIKTRDGGKPVAKLTKSYTLQRQTAQKKNRQTYDLGFAILVENLTDRPIQTILVQQGPIGFSKEAPRAEDRYVISAIWEPGEPEPVIEGYQRTKLKDQQTIELGGDNDGRRIAWIAQANNYFACIMAPAGRKDLQDTARFETAEAIRLTDNQTEALSADLTFRYVTKPIDIPPGGSEEVAFDCYIGPKCKPIFDNVEAYTQRYYGQVLDYYFYLCAPDALVGVMMKLLNLFHALWPHNYGIALICLVLLVRAALHPITKKSQVNMAKMQQQMSKLQPKIQAAKEKYANDRAAMNRATMEVYKEEGINPAGNILSCLPMFLQIPIWGALWAALNYAIELRHEPFDGWWIVDLTKPDALIAFAHPFHIPLISGFMGGPIESFNLLPIFLGISQLLQTKFMPRGNVSAKSSGGTDQLEQQRKMMMFMSGFFILILYNAPSGLNLYIMASNLFGILEQYRIRKHLAELQEKQEHEPPPESGPGGKKAAPPKTAPAKPRPTEPRKKSWFQRKWEGLQKEAEEARRQQSSKKKGKQKTRALRK